MGKRPESRVVNDAGINGGWVSLQTGAGIRSKSLCGFLCILALAVYFAALAEPPVARADEVAMVKDIIPGTSGSSPSLGTNVNGTLYFCAGDSTNGRELWKSDGTEAGTVMVKDINPGLNNSNLAYLTNVNGILYFAANDGVHGQELWRSDGTAVGTVMVKDINPGAGGSTPEYLTNVNGALYFRANDGTNGVELWRSESTSGNTVLVKDINPGAADSGPQYLTNVNGTLFFAADDGTHKQELWKSDGMEFSTVMVKDIAPSCCYSELNFLTSLNGVLYFSATDGSTANMGLWRSDGTEGGTRLVKYVGGETPNSGVLPHDITVVDEILFFKCGHLGAGWEWNALWKSDGTEQGTVMIKYFGDTYANLQPDIPMIGVNGTLFYIGTDGVHGDELWKSDGTENGTVMVKNIWTGSGDMGFSYLTDFNGTLYFRTNDGAHGYELWRSDGTADGTVMVQDIRPGSSSSNPANLTVVNDTLYFTANDGVHGGELWRTICNDHKTRIGDTASYRCTLQAAYNDAPNPGTVKAWATGFIENLMCDQAKDIIIEGGYDEDYTGNSGFTTVTSLTVIAGTVTIENVTIQ